MRRRQPRTFARGSRIAVARNRVPCHQRDGCLFERPSRAGRDGSRRASTREVTRARQHISPTQFLFGPVDREVMGYRIHLCKALHREIDPTAHRIGNRQQPQVPRGERLVEPAQLRKDLAHLSRGDGRLAAQHGDPRHALQHPRPRPRGVIGARSHQRLASYLVGSLQISATFVREDYRRQQRRDVEAAAVWLVAEFGERAIGELDRGVQLARASPSLPPRTKQPAIARRRAVASRPPTVEPARRPPSRHPRAGAPLRRPTGSAAVRIARRQLTPAGASGRRRPAS